MDTNIATRIVWRDAAGWRTLDRNRVDVWRVELDRDAIQIAPAGALLSADELARAARYRFDKDRTRFICMRGILRVILSRNVELPPAQIEFTYNEHGKPALAFPAGENAIHFNVSHSDRVGLIAVGRGRQVGVDIERIRSDFAADDIVERFLSAEQAALIRSAPPNLKSKIFFQSWTQFEARVKASGANLDFQPLGNAHWHVQSLDVDEEYAAALAVEGDAPQIEYWKGEFFG